MRKKRFLLITVLLPVFLAALIAFGIEVCGECGYEIPEGETRCQHCNAETKKSGETQEIKPVSRPDGVIDSKTVAEEVGLGEEWLGKGDVEVARMLFRNSLILHSLANDPANDAEMSKVSDLLRKCEEAARTASGKCPICDGTGKRKMTVDSLISGKKESVEAFGMSCPGCKGTGYILKRATIGEQVFARGQAVGRYTALQRSKRFESVGGAWLPQGALDELSVRQIAAVKKAAADPCKTCMGMGLMDCGKCSGAGKIKCTASGCKDGTVTITVTGSLVKGTMKRTEKCKMCKGTGLVACDSCLARGAVPCKECKGTGERDQCAKCGGQGYSNCRRCGGTGMKGDARCNACADGFVLCQSCNGDGRKR